MNNPLPKMDGVYLVVERESGIMPCVFSKDQTTIESVKVAASRSESIKASAIKYDKKTETYYVKLGGNDDKILEMLDNEVPKHILFRGGHFSLKNARAEVRRQLDHSGIE